MSTFDNRQFTFIQDGARFYDEHRDTLIAEYPGKVTDYDMKAAKAARHWFLENYPEYA